MRQLCRQPPQPAPVAIHDIEVRLVGVAHRLTRGFGQHFFCDKRNRAPIRRPGRTEIVRRSPRHVAQPAPVGVHDVDLGVAVASAHERELPPVARPARMAVARRLLGQVLLPAAVGVHHVDLGVAVASAHERELPSVGRPRRCLHVALRGLAVDQLEDVIPDGDGGRNEKPGENDHRGDGDCTPGRQPRATVWAMSFRAVAYVIPIGDHRRHRKDPFEGIGDLELKVSHRTASLWARRSAACAAASVADTVPTSTSRAVAIDR